MAFISVLEGPRPKTALAKVLGSDAEAKLPKYWDSITLTEVADTLDLWLLLTDLEHDPFRCMVLGRPGEANQFGKWRRSLQPLPKNKQKPDLGTDPAGLIAGPGAGLMVIDHDSGVWPEGCGPDTPPERTAKALVGLYVTRAGMAAGSVSCAVQFSGSHLVKGCRAKLFFIFGKVQKWKLLHDYIKGRMGADQSVSSPAQILYTAAPVIEAGVDPMGGAGRTYHIQGDLEAWPDIDKADTDVDVWTRLHRACVAIRGIPVGEPRHPVINNEAWQVGRYVAVGRLDCDLAVKWLVEACEQSEAVGTERVDPDEVRRAVLDGDRAPMPTRAAVDSLMLDQKGGVKPTLLNAVTLLSESVHMVENDFGDLELLSPPPWDAKGNYAQPVTFDDGHILQATCWLQSEFNVAFRPAEVSDAAKTIGTRNQVNRLMDYLERVQHLPEGPLTVDNIGVKGWKSEATEAHQLGAMKFFVQAVKRAYEPGCKAELVLVIQGNPGLGKSRSVRELFTRPGDKYFTSSHIPIGQPQVYAHTLRGLWCAELSEQRSVTQWHQDNFKTFLSLQDIRHRMPYERRATTFKLRSVYAWSTEEDCPLTDSNYRRMIIIRAEGWCDPTPDEVDAFWGSCVRAYKAGRRAWIDDSEAAVLQDSREAALALDALHYDVEAILHQSETAEALQPHRHVMHVLASQQKYGVKVGDVKVLARVRQIMTRLGWKKKVKRLGPDKVPTRTWLPPADWEWDGPTPPSADVVSMFPG